MCVLFARIAYAALHSAALHSLPIGLFFLCVFVCSQRLAVWEVQSTVAQTLLAYELQVDVLFITDDDFYSSVPTCLLYIAEQEYCFPKDLLLSEGLASLSALPADRQGRLVIIMNERVRSRSARLYLSRSAFLALPYR